MTYSLSFETPVGRLTVTATAEAVTEVRFGGNAPKEIPASADTNAGALLRQTVCELEEYFAGTRRTFSLPLAPAGTPFQQAVWAALRTIPYGETRSYKQIAEQIGNPAACRAVGMANNRNPIPIVIPCHRVVGHNGKLVGYAGGLEVKSRLLTVEKP